MGFSKLLINEQREIMQQLNQLVRKTAQFQTSEANGKLISIPSGDGMALVFFQSLEEPVQCALEISRLVKNYPRLCEWEPQVDKQVRNRRLRVAR